MRTSEQLLRYVYETCQAHNIALPSRTRLTGDGTKELATDRRPLLDLIHQHLERAEHERDNTGTIFAVTGRGEFPLDMLRYDMCHPVEPSAHASIPNVRELRTIKLHSRYPHGLIHPGRWESFGWKVTSINNIEV